jgi:hypothetical protein
MFEPFMMLFPLLFWLCLSSRFKKSFLCRSMMYFVKFRAALRGKFMNWKTANLKLAPVPNSLAATLRSFAFYLALPISSIPDVTDEAEKKKNRRERKQRTSSGYPSVLSVQSVVS